MNEMDDVRRPLPQQSVKFMHQIRMDIRARNLAYKTEKTYCFWIKRYIKYHSLLMGLCDRGPHVQLWPHRHRILSTVRLMV